MKPAAIVLALLVAVGAAPGVDESLPVVPAVALPEIEHKGVANLLSIDWLYASIRQHGSDTGLTVDFSGIGRLLDGTTVRPRKIYGRIAFGPYPFEAGEAAYEYKRFRPTARVEQGRSFLKLSSLLKPKLNSEEWTDRGRVAVRFDLYEQSFRRDRHLGLYDIFVRFARHDSGFVRLPSLVAGPFVHRLTSDDPSRCVVEFETDVPVYGEVRVDTGGPAGEVFADGSRKARHHLVELSGLAAGKRYTYRVYLDGAPVTEAYPLRAAPEPGTGPVAFVYSGDSREGVGGGERQYMGTNAVTLHRLLAYAYNSGADFFLMGGDLVNGHTTVPADFAQQLHAWKQTCAAFWHEHPVFPAMGNHEVIMRAYEDGTAAKVRLDRWPYDSVGSESAFARAFVNPDNGPAPDDPRRPSYRENVYSFTYGIIRAVCFNNNYWYSNRWSTLGGSPEGYIMEDQMRWLREELERAQRDSSIAYVFLYAQEPVFPCGGHVGDAMWYDGDNRVRAHVRTEGSDTVTQLGAGIVEVRNELVRMIAACPKVAAVFGSDEHAYFRLLIDNKVPVGDPESDDRDGDGVVCEEGEPCSALDDLAYPTWYITSGGAGAPYYAEEETPWNRFWKERYPDRDERRTVYVHSSQENMVLIRADRQRVSCTVFNPYGEVIDKVEDLMAVKRGRRTETRPGGSPGGVGTAATSPGGR